MIRRQGEAARLRASNSAGGKPVPGVSARRGPARIWLPPWGCTGDRRKLPVVTVSQRPVSDTHHRQRPGVSARMDFDGNA